MTIMTMKFSRSRFVLLPVAVGLATLAGCGGGNSNYSNLSSTASTPLKLTINWPARSRDVNAVSSAQSFIVSASSGEPNAGGPIDWPYASRNGGAAAFSQAYVTPSNVRVGDRKINIRFYAQANGTGSVVGDATVNATIASDGTGVPTINVASKVASVVVTPQTVNYGNTTNVVYTAYDASTPAAVLALTVGSAFFAQTGGSGAATLSADGSVTTLPANNTLAPLPNGPLDNITLTATVDGVVSSPQPLKVVVGAGALTTTASGLKYRDVVTGTGTAATSGQNATVTYFGYYDKSDISGGLSDSGNYAPFDTSFKTGGGPLAFRLGSGAVVPGFDEAVRGMLPGGIRVVVIPPALAYGANPPAGSNIPANAALIFVLQLVSTQ